MLSKIGAIKEIRRVTGLGLKESLAAYNALDEQDAWAKPSEQSVALYAMKLRAERAEKRAERLADAVRTLAQVV